MSFFGQGYPYHPAHYHPRRGPFPATPAYPFTQHQAPSPPAYNDYYGPAPGQYSPPAHHHDDFDAEERAALAHLQAIQRRREAATARVSREAEIRAERELAFHAALQREREARERAIQQARERQAAIQSAREERLAAIQAAKEEHERAIRQQHAVARAEAFQALKTRAIEAAKAKAYAIAQSQAQQVARRAAIAAEEKRRYFQARQEHARWVSAAQCAAQTKDVKEEAKEENKGYEGLKVINDLLGGLFGINLALDTPAPAAETKEEEKKKKATPAPTTEKPTSAPTAEAKTSTPAAATPDKPAETKESTNDTPFPTEINELLSHFLGLRVDPAGKDGAASGQPNKDVISGLNNLLGQFGFEFEPSPAPEAPKASGSGSSSAAVSATPAPKPSSTAQAPKPSPANESKSAPTPIANFLNGNRDIPFFIRDILSNVEVALTQGQDFHPEPEVQGKGKSVAPGEKTARAVPAAPQVKIDPPTPVQTATASIEKLNTISHELFLATESFEFPAKLTFAHPSESTEAAPQLLFNKVNSGYHAQAHKLLQLLLAADGVSSEGDKDVRQKRKEVVRAVEGAIEALETKRDRIWDQVKVKRDNGEESEDEGGHSSGVSTTSDIEHIELADVEAEPTEPTPVNAAKDVKVDEVAEVVFDVNEHEKDETAPAPTPAAETEKDAVVDVEQKDTTDKVEPVEETENPDEVESDDKAENKVTGTSTPRSVTVEDQEEGYEVL